MSLSFVYFSIAFRVMFYASTYISSGISANFTVGFLLTPGFPASFDIFFGYSSFFFLDLPFFPFLRILFSKNKHPNLLCKKLCILFENQLHKTIHQVLLKSSIVILTWETKWQSDKVTKYNLSLNEITINCSIW